MNEAPTEVGAGNFRTPGTKWKKPQKHSERKGRFPVKETELDGGHQTSGSQHFITKYQVCGKFIF